jgi:hypothetical protein
VALELSIEVKKTTKNNFQLLITNYYDKKCRYKYRLYTIKLHTLNVNKIWWLKAGRTSDILLGRTKNRYFFTKSFERQLHNLCLIIRVEKNTYFNDLNYSVHKKMWINFDLFFEIVFIFLFIILKTFEIKVSKYKWYEII